MSSGASKPAPRLAGSSGLLASQLLVRLRVDLWTDHASSGREEDPPIRSELVIIVFARPSSATPT